ncbi:unnamed protein product [Alopecurus aequalis]
MAGQEQKSWIVDVEELLGQDGSVDAGVEAARWQKHSIYRVPAHVKNDRYVSYHGRSDLVPMEEHKQRALLHFIRRTGRVLVEALEEVVERLKDAYLDLDDKWRLDTNGFLRVMVMDGCFLLEVMRAGFEDGWFLPKVMITEVEDGQTGKYADSDPVFSLHGQLYMFPHVRRDMLMMENQLPLLVLQKLVAVVYGPDAATNAAINNMVLKFLSLMPGPPVMCHGSLALRPIDVCHRSLLHLHGQPRGTSKGRKDEFVPSATELDQAGVQLRSSATRSLHDISFLGGVLYIPELTVDDYTEHKLFSVMAFERLHTRAAANKVTVTDDKEVAKMFNRLANRAVLAKCSPLRAVHEQVNAYCDKRWNQWRASLIRKHADNPWAIVSLVAAGFLLGLTVVQTLYTLVPYYQQQTSTG